LTGHRYMADVVPTRIGLDSHHLTHFEVEVFVVYKKLFPGSLEPDLHNIEGFIICWHVHIGQPIVYIQLITSACPAGAVVLATCRCSTCSTTPTAGRATATSHNYRYI